MRPQLFLAEQNAADVRAIGREAFVTTLAVSDLDSIARRRRGGVREHFGRIDVLIDNAGVIS